MIRLKSIILEDRKVLSGNEKVHLLAVLDIFKHSINTFSILFDKDLTIRFSFKIWRGWSWNDVMLIDNQKINQLENFTNYISCFRHDIHGITNDYLAEDSSCGTYFISINKQTLSFDFFLNSFCSESIKTKLDYLLMIDEIKGEENKTSKSSKI